jgi:hypothetical protein
MTENKLFSITKIEAENLFNNGTVIYIQAEDLNLAPESCNTFMLSNKIWDASLNIYKSYKTPAEYGFNNIINWITERTGNKSLFYTYHSSKFLLIY